tara:strand:+ start:483 stop:602 length:120 start_codon:yes stop_codon:yes gene_type:complete
VTIKKSKLYLFFNPTTHKLGLLTESFEIEWRAVIDREKN